MKKIIAVLLFFILVISGCGKDAANSVSKSTDAEKSAEVTADAMPEFELLDTNEQVGGITLSQESYLYDGFQVLEDGDYTYFFDTVDLNEFTVSVEKDNQWLELEKTISIEDERLTYNSIVDQQVMASDNSLLIEFDLTGDQGAKSLIFNVNFDSKGNIDAKLIKDNTVTENSEVSIIRGSSGKVFIYEEATNGDKKPVLNIYDDKGKVVYRANNKNQREIHSSSANDAYFLDEDKGTLQVDDTVYDLNSDDYVTDENGNEIQFDSFSSYATSVVKPNRDFLYQVSTVSYLQPTLIYSQVKKDFIIEMASYTLPEEAEDRGDAFMVMNKDNIHVYTVIDNGEASSLQLYTFERIDKNKG
ncbi:hypothetical protein SFC66_07890 [Terribacillus saccharophilus]|uniref:hypothetical protein n=1 Tax=Terribacillus saccharophilus TaxID=361277 RepID=UPI0039821B9C